MGIGVTVDPERGQPAGSRTPVDQDGWACNTDPSPRDRHAPLPNPLLARRPSSPLPHSPTPLSRSPGPSAIGASAKSYITTALQITSIIPADIIIGVQCATTGGGHARNPGGVDII